MQPFLNFKADIIEQPVASAEQPELAKNSIAKTPANCVATPPTEVSLAEKTPRVASSVEQLVAFIVCFPADDADLIILIFLQAVKPATSPAELLGTW